MLNTAAVIAQSLPRNPTPGQLPGYRIQKQKEWINQQLPRNSVLYKFSSPNNSAEPYSFSSKKTKPPVIKIPGQNVSSGFPQLNYSLPTQLPGKKLEFILTQKEYSWEDSTNSKVAELLKGYNIKQLPALANGDPN